MRIAVDVMGGDHAPQAAIEGVHEIWQEKILPDARYVLVGQQERIEAYLDSFEDSFRDVVEVIHAEEEITADDDPVKSVRRKKNSSMVKALELVKEKEVDACVSAGNTGALMAGGLLMTGRLSGVDRPALASQIPTVNGNGVLFLDLGANAEYKPEHLYQFAVMANVYLEKIIGIKRPRIALLNIGTEENKGPEGYKKAYQLLKDSSLNFVGNMEGRDIISGKVDVIIADGFTGNITLKVMEGVAIDMFAMVKEELTADFTSKVGGLITKPALKRVYRRMDYRQYGGAPLFGLNGLVVKCHGSSDGTAFKNALRVTGEMITKELVASIKSEIDKGIEERRVVVD